MFATLAMTTRRCVLAAVLITLAGCQVTGPSKQGDQAAVAPGFMAATAHPLATEAAQTIMASGGNAADAAIAAAFALTVVEPSMNGIGGRNQILVRTPDGRFFGYEGMTEIPASFIAPETPAISGYGTIATPGALAALGRLHAEQGSLPWADLVAPAIRYAADGFRLLPGEAARHAAAVPAVADDPGFQRNVLKADGTARAAGELWVQPVLAETLRQIAEGGTDTFYTGEIADRIVSDFEARGGFITHADLEGYRVRDGRYVSTSYRGYEVHTVAAPGGGGLVVKSLNLLESLDLAKMTELEWATAVNQALALAVQTMESDYAEADLEKVQSKDWARRVAAAIRIPAGLDASAHPARRAGGDFDAEARSDRSRIDAPGASVPGGAGPRDSTDMTDWTGASWGADSHHTTHFVTADCEGGAVSITQTLGPLFGSKVITPDLGFAWASTMGAYLSTADQAPGSRPRTTIAPTIVTRNGEPVLILGAAGGLRILSAIVETISRVVDRNLDPVDAVAAPRVHPMVETDAATRTRTVKLLGLHAETSPGAFSEDDVDALRAAGVEVKPQARVGAFGRIHAIARTEDGWLGVADPDWEGSARGGVTCGGTAD